MPYFKKSKTNQNTFCPFYPKEKLTNSKANNYKIKQGLHLSLQILCPCEIIYVYTFPSGCSGKYCHHQGNLTEQREKTPSPSESQNIVERQKQVKE